MILQVKKLKRLLFMKLIKLGNKLKLIKPDSCYYMGGVNVLPPPATVIEYFFFAISSFLRIYTIDYNNVSNTSLILGTFNPMITWYAFPLIEHPCVPIALK